MRLPHAALGFAITVLGLHSQLPLGMLHSNPNACLLQSV